MIGIHIIPEQKINWERLNLMTLCRELGYAPWVSAMSVLGGLVGGPEGGAVAVTANFMEQLSMSGGKMGSIFVSDLQGANNSREALWALSAALRALERNLGVATGTPGSNTSSVFSLEEDICRSAALALVLTASGGAYNWAAGKSPEDTKIQHEVMAKTAGLSREGANARLNALYRLIEDLAKEGTTPLNSQQEFRFPKLYDVATGEPKPEYLQGCRRARELLTEVGVL
ncbi:MAG TPA: monomethylamine:corrinoid methyltransferase [Clostridia bacterium]|nr:monomethylamine:corrinoid methyltransferase [Clostridia bacterium]